MSYFYPEALNAMEIIARDLCQKRFPNVQWTVRVIADSVTGTASVDWNGNPNTDTYVYVTINMPIRKATYRMSADEFRHWAAYLLHEVGHPFSTDKQEWKAAVAVGKHKLLNSLEDVREEKETIESGIAANAVKVFGDLIDMLHAQAVAGGYDPNEPQSIGWTLSTLGRQANGYAIECDDIYLKLDPNGIVGRIVPWALADLAACQSTLDCRTLSDKIIKAVNDAMKAERDAQPPVIELPVEPAMPEPQGGMTETRGEHEDEEFVEEPDAPQPDNTPVIPEDNDATTPHGEIGAEAPVQPDADGDQTVEVDAPAEDEPEDDDLFTDADIEERDMNPNQNDNITSNGTDAYTQRKLTAMLRRAIEKASQPVVERNITGRTTQWGLGGYATTVDYVVGSASKMGRQRALLARAMKANEMDDFDGGRRMGRLDRRVVHKLATRTSDAVFGLRTVTEGYDTDVQILVDGSGSMAGNRILAASALALVVAQAAAQVGVDCTAHVFTDNGLTVATKGKAKPIGKKFGYMFNQITGGTPLTENLLLAAELQHKRSNGKRKIMFVITDGDCDSGADVVKAAGQYIEGKGTEIANLHIGSQAMGLFRNEVAVNVRKVSEVGLKQLTRVLEAGAN